MIKLPINNKLLKLSNVLDKIIEEYTPPGRIMGSFDENPKLSEEDLKEIIKNKKDVVVAPDVYAYFINKKNHEDELWKVSKDLFPNSNLASISGRFHYPAKGFMGWHTNSNMEGCRVYATRSKEKGKSFFRYFSDGKMVTEWEEAGWNFRAFQVIKNKPYWHCVYSDTDRFSFGLRFN